MALDNEYSFWWSVRNNKIPFDTLSGEQQQAYMLLENKIALYGSGSLNKKGWGWSPDVTKPYGGINEGQSSSEPEMVNSVSEISSGPYQTVEKVTGQPNMYMTTDVLNSRKYYFVVPKMPSMPKKEPKSPPSSTPKIIKPPKAGAFTTYSGPRKPKKEPQPIIKEIPSQYDLLFNSLSYMSVGEAEIEKMSMDLIFAGDDLLTDFNYKSIDYLPDFEVQTTNKYNDYVNASSVLNQTEVSDSGILANNKAGIREPNLSDQIISELVSHLQETFENQPFSKITNYFGSMNGDSFVPGVSKGQYIDFYYKLPEEYAKYDITIDFNPI